MMLSAAVGVSGIGVCLRSYREYQINSVVQISKQGFCQQVGNRQEISELLYLEFLCHPVLYNKEQKHQGREVGDLSCLVMSRYPKNAVQAFSCSHCMCWFGWAIRNFAFAALPWACCMWWVKGKRTFYPCAFGFLCISVHSDFSLFLHMSCLLVCVHSGLYGI